MSQSVKVLIVDDEDLIRLNLRALLEDLDYGVVEAANGQEGLDIFDRERPDLVLADLRMPVMDGLAMIAGLREQSPDTPVIVVSGTGTVRDAVNSVRLGAWDYVIKPVEEVEEFEIIITRALERAQLIRDNRRYREHLEDLVRERTTELRESETRYRRLLESVTSYVYTVTIKDGRPDATVHGPGCEAVTGFTPEEYAADPYLWYRMVHDDDRSRVVAMTQGILDERLPVAFEHRLSHKDGAVRWVNNTLVPHRTARGELLSYDGIVVDITERKRAEAALQASETRYRIVADNTYDWEFWLNPQGQFLYSSPSCERITGYTPTDFEANPNLLYQIIHPDDLSRYECHHQKALCDHSEPEQEFRIIRSDDTQRWIGHVCGQVYDETGQFFGVRGSNRDITERKRAAETLHRLNRELQAFRICNQTLLRAVNEQTLLNDICQIVCDEAGYRMAWVGYVEHDDAQTVRPVARAGVEDGYLANANITWADTERGRGPTGTAIRTGESTCIQDFMTDPQVVPWRENALQRGYRSSLALPLKNENASTFGALNIYAAKANAFTPDEIRLLEELAEDLAFGIVTLRTRAERKRAEETLRENERLLAEIAANYPNSYLSIVEKDLTIGFTSGQEFKKQHLDPGSFIGLSLEQVFGEQAPIVREHYLKTFQGEETSFELFIHNQYQLYNVVPLYDRNGHVTRILTVVENITARKQAERELQRSNDLLRAIIEAAPTAIIGLDLDGNVQIVWNPAAEKMLGWSAQEAMGHLLPSVPVESQEEFRRFREWIRSGQTLNGVEVRRQKRDGSPIDYSIYASPLHDADGRITGNVAVLVDITERKRAEAEINKLTRAVEQSPAAIVITDTAGNIEYVNPRFTQITGYTSAEVLGQNPRILKSGETPPEEYQRLWEIITHGDVWRGEFHNKKKTSDLYWESASISPVIDAQGAITHFVAVKEDITVRKQTEEALRILNEELELRVRHRTAELETANKELQEFAYIVSHDLKAPLRGIRRLTQWLQEDYAGVLDTQGQEQLDLLGEQGKRMDTMIDGILHYSKAGYGGERKESIELNTLVAQVIQMLMLPAHITIRCENTLPVIHGDPIQLMQVFQNLLSNAVKFMDKPIGKITVASKDAGEEWIFRVEDNGPGIEPRHHEHIFKIFQSCIPRDERESNGIGLAVVKKIVELYGGRVWVESTPGHGSCFSFTWPKRTGKEA